MNYIKKPLVVLLTVVLSGLTGIAANSQAQSTALERGYRTGYSDGYSSGAGDAANKVAADYQNKEEYKRADRSFNDVWGPIEDYRDGYQQGFEAGYTAGYEHRDFNSSIPTGLRRRPASENASTNAPVNADVTTNPEVVPSTNNSDNTNVAQQQTGSPGSLGIPKDTVLYLELLTPLSTEATQRNDPFRARVTGPNPFADYIVEGRVSQVKRPGKVKGVAELQLTFEQIRSPDNRTASFRAELVEVMPLNSDSPTDVDSEGGVRGRDSTKDDAAKIGAASGIGAIIGVITGGGKGSAIGAIIGAGAGTAGVMTQRGKDIRLERGQPMKIRTSTDTSVL